MNDPWTFGWTQVLTIVGFAITLAVAVGGFGTFERWRKQKLEEKKIACSACGGERDRLLRSPCS
jgi:hypothetical protein